MALDLLRGECPRRESEAVEAIERAEAGETLAQAQIKEIVEKAVIASHTDVEAQLQRVRD
jgi:hypothetical protein